jgi:hypothetical protein
MALEWLQARARADVPPVPRHLFDGFVGAAHTTALLRAVARGEATSGIGAAQEIASTRIDREVTSS